MVTAETPQSLIIMLLCIPIRPTKAVKVQLHLFLTSAPIGVEWLPCAPQLLYLWAKSPLYPINVP